MIILDLEWNRGYDNKPLEEVLQIGAVRTAGLGQPILDTFNAYIRPVVHKRFGPGAKDLPELSASLESELDFAAALARFLDWCGGEEEFASWGGDDGKVLEQNCRYWDCLSPSSPDSITCSGPSAPCWGPQDSRSPCGGRRPTAASRTPSPSTTLCTTRCTPPP